MENIIESTVNAEPVVNVEPQITEQVATNESVEKVEVAEQPKVEEKPVQSAEDNAKYAAIRREAEQKAASKARDEMIAEMYGQSHGIYTYADYQKAVEAQKEAERLEELKQQMPEELAREMLENKKFREQYEAEQKTRAEQAAKEKEMSDFLDLYPNLDPKEIPDEVFRKVEQGTPIKYAYLEHLNTKLETELKEYKKGTKTLETNNKNAAATTGSTTGNGSLPNEFISKEAFEANKSNGEWMSQNYELLKKSMNKW